MTARRHLLRGAAACGLIAAVSGSAAAQTTEQPGRIEVAAGASWIGRQSFGSAAAGETTPSGGTLNLFTTSSELASAPAIEARVGVRLLRTLVVSAEAGYARPEIRVTTSADVEGGASITAAERIQQFTVGGGATWYLPVATRRFTPFVTGGGGYLRQLHQNAVLVQTGRYFDAGGGVAYPLSVRPDRRMKTTGIRIDARAIVFQDGVAFTSGRHTAAELGGSFFVRF